MGQTHNFLMHVSPLRHRRHDRGSWKKLFPRIRETNCFNASGTQALQAVFRLAPLSGWRIPLPRHSAKVYSSDYYYYANYQKQQSHSCSSCKPMSIDVNKGNETYEHK